MDISALKNNLRVNSQFLPKNLASLSENHFDTYALEIQKNLQYSKTELVIYHEHFKSVHSKINPLIEAKRLIDVEAAKLNNRLVVLPADLLYALEHALSQRLINENGNSDSNEDLLVILYYQDWQHFLTCWSLRIYDFLKKISFVIHIPKVWAITEIDLKIATAKGNYFIHNIAYQKTKKKFIEENKKAYYQFISDWYTSQLTQFYFEKKWILNGLLNLKLNDFRNLANLKKIVNSGPCQIVGAGPSLKQGLNYLKQLKEKGGISTVFCLDTALMALLSHGIEPDFIVTLDSGYANSLDFEILPSDKCSLIADISTHPAMFKHFQGEKYLYVSTGIGETVREINDKRYISESKEKLFSYLCKENSFEEKVPVVPSHGSVIHTAYHIAIYMGFSEITFHGLDFSSPFFDSHIYTGAHFSYYYNKSNRTNPICSQDFKLIKPSLGNELEKSPSDSLFYRELGLYDYGKKLESILSNKAKHFSSSLWGLRLRGVSYEEKIFIDPAIINQSNINIKNEVRKRNSLEYFLKVDDKKYTELISLKFMLLKSLRAIEEKKSKQFDQINSDLLKCFEEINFLNDVLKELSFHLNRRHKENIYQKYYHLYRELFKFIYVIEQKIF